MNPTEYTKCLFQSVPDLTNARQTEGLKPGYMNTIQQLAKHIRPHYSPNIIEIQDT